MRNLPESFEALSLDRIEALPRPQQLRTSRRTLFPEPHLLVPVTLLRCGMRRPLWFLDPFVSSPQNRTALNCCPIRILATPPFLKRRGGQGKGAEEDAHGKVSQWAGLLSRQAMRLRNDSVWTSGPQSEHLLCSLSHIVCKLYVSFGHCSVKLARLRSSRRSWFELLSGIIFSFLFSSAFPFPVVEVAIVYQPVSFFERFPCNSLLSVDRTYVGHSVNRSLLHCSRRIRVYCV